MSDPTAPVEGAPAAAAPESSGQPEPWAPVLDRVGELASTVGELQNGFQSFLQAQQPEPEAPDDPWAALFPEDTEPEYQEPQPQALDPHALQAAIQQAIAQSNAPLQAQLQQMQLERATQQLYQDIPQLAPSPENQEIRQQTHQMVVQSLQGYPEEIANQLASDPKYIATVFKAAEADKRAQGEVPAGGPIHQQEAAGGALPGGNAAPVNPVDQAYAHRVELPSGFGR